VRGGGVDGGGILRTAVLLWVEIFLRTFGLAVSTKFWTVAFDQGRH
jgi:hypothetical protein